LTLLAICLFRNHTSSTAAATIRATAIAGGVTGWVVWWLLSQHRNPLIHAQLVLLVSQLVLGLADKHKLNHTRGMQTRTVPQPPHDVATTGWQLMQCNSPMLP
jgi:hypothetical protein